MSQNPYSHLYRFVNTLLFGLLGVLGVSGVVMLYGAWLPWVFDLHRWAGFALIFVAPWKALIIARSLRRGPGRTFDRRGGLLVSLALLLLVLVVVVLGGMWIFRLGPYMGPLYQTLLAWHWILGLALLPVAAFHAWRHWPNPRRQDLLNRRSFLQAAGLAAAGVLAGELADLLGAARATAAQPRRFTGSRGFGLFTGNDFPLTGEAPPALDLAAWRLHLTGAVAQPLVLTRTEILALPPHTRTATLDCTNGWYSVQDWQGLPLRDLLAAAGAPEDAAGVRLVSATGYNHTYPLAEARTILLATHVTGEPLSASHGAPLRAVVPGRRGWFWVKWLVEVEVLAEEWQVLAGLLASPRETLRQW